MEKAAYFGWLLYVFVGKSRTTMKLLHWERGGYVM